MRAITNFRPEKMFVRGDFDLNSVQRYTDSLREAFKQTIMNQEVIFRKQVHELHRLYRVQITLMKDLDCEEFGRYNSWEENTQLSVLHHTNPTRYEPQAEEARFSSISAVGLTLPIKMELIEGWQDRQYKPQQPFDLQIPADQFISHLDRDFQDNGNVSNHLKHTLENHIHNKSDAMDLKLSLGLVVDSRREGTKKSWLDKKTHSCTQVVIDLEDSTERRSKVDAEEAPSLGCTGFVTYFAGKHESQVSVLSDLSIPRSVKKDISREITVSSSLVDEGECYQGWQSSNQEFRKSQDDIPCNYLSIKKQQKPTSCDARQLDLNKIQLDDSYCYSNDPIMAYPSTASSSGAIVGSGKENFCPTTIWRKEINNCSSRTSEMLHQLDSNATLALMNSSGKNEELEIWHSSSKLGGTDETEASPAGLKSISQLPTDLGEFHGSCCSDPKNNRDKLTSEVCEGLLNDLNHICVATKQMSCEKSEVENTVYSYSGQSLEKHGDKCAALRKSCCVVDNASSNIKTTQSGIESGNSSTAIDQFSGIHVQSQVAEILSGDQERGSGNSEHGCINKKEESAEVDVLIQRAAESLIDISLENSVCFQECSTRSGSNEIENVESGQPQNSYDSFELIALNLTESSSDDYCVSSKPFEVNDKDKRDFGIKLRRGRRLKDFQKDILPGLASLSRHEICEDINILEGVLRSKEYRRNRARMGGENWCPPLRSRRTRFNYTRRRSFL